MTTNYPKLERGDENDWVVLDQVDGVEREVFSTKLKRDALAEIQRRKKGTTGKKRPSLEARAVRRPKTNPVETLMLEIERTITELAADRDARLARDSRNLLPPLEM